MKRRRATEKNPLAPYKAHILKWKRGMEEMNRAVIEERKKLTMEERFESVIKLMEFARSIPMTPKRARFREQNAEVARMRWAQLRKALRG